MQRTFLIDGYNLLHQVPEFSDQEGEDLESRRERLLRRLVGWSAQRAFHLRVIFDGSKSHSSRGDLPGIEVRFVPPPADDFIRHVIEKSAGSRHLVVVSSDRKDIGHYAKIHSIEWMTSEQFWQWISELGQKKTTPKISDAGAPPGWTEQDDAELRKIFEGE